MNVGVSYTHLSDKLDDLDKNVEGHVSGNNAATPFGEQCGGDGCQAAKRGREKPYVPLTYLHFSYNNCLIGALLWNNHKWDWLTGRL